MEIQSFQPGPTISRAGTKFWHQHLSMNRPASAHGAEMTAAEQAMWDRLEFVSVKDMQDAMVKASIPGAATTVWKVDLITLAIQHEFNYIVPRMRLVKPAAIPMQQPLIVVPFPAIPMQQPLIPVPFAAIPLQPPPASRNAPPGPSAVQEVPLKRVRAEPKVAAPDAVVQESAVAGNMMGMGVAGTIMNLYEAKWSQVFSPTPLCRGFIFSGEFSCEEIRIEIGKMALASGCNFWKTDAAKMESADGFVQSLTFRCPHYPDPNYYKEKKGRKTSEDSIDPWRNENRNGQHVTGTLCPARFTINGKKTGDATSDKYIWRVSPMFRAKFSMEHVGHPEPYAKYLQKMVLTCHEKKTITEMVNAGMASNQISAFLSSNGQRGAISKQTIGFIASEISKWDTELNTIRAKAVGVSAAQALVDNLQALPNCTVIMLYKDLQSADNQLNSMIAGKLDVFKVTVEEMNHVSRGNNADSEDSDAEIESQPASLLRRTWAACCSAWKGLLHEPIVGAAPRSQLKPATATENDKNRMLIVNGRQCLLLALLWAFDEEKTMFSKYPEILHHDVKGKVCQWAMPWWFSVGVNGRRGNFIAIRGWIHNESRAMFRFCEKALIHVHGRFLKFLVCHCCDGDPDLIAVLISMCSAGGSSPWARLVRCFWHIENRGIIHEFKNLTDPWIKQLISILWRACTTLETPQEFETVWKWVVDVWTPRVCGKVKGLPVGEQCNATQATLLPDFLERIYISREYWCLAWKLTIPSMNTAVNTRAETENGVLVKHVRVHGGMAPGKMAEGEARVSSNAYQRENRDDFSKLNRQVVSVNECEKLMTAAAYAIQHHQVLVAQHCYHEGSSSIQLCAEALQDCEICSSTMLPHQGGCRDRERHPLWFPNAIHDNVVARFDTKISYTEPLSHPRDVIDHSGAESTYS
jgi:hypothetical protein